jgi:hypothetical protein
MSLAAAVIERSTAADHEFASRCTKARRHEAHEEDVLLKGLFVAFVSSYHRASGIVTAAIVD